MGKIKLTKIKTDDFDYFKSLAPKAKDSKTMFSEVKVLAYEGRESMEQKQILNKIGEGLYGKKVWQKLFK